MANDTTRFVYVTYIRTTPEKLWAALTQPEFTKQYWFGVTMKSGWKAGADWQMMYDDGRVMDAGSIVEADAPRRLVIKWRNEWKPEFKAEGYSRCTMEIEQTADSVKLSVTHEMDVANSGFINEGVSNGWPKILSNLKSLLETGSVLMAEKV
ncbi:MAG: SRPBCC family protein [Vitreimonas sp.]